MPADFSFFMTAAKSPDEVAEILCRVLSVRE